MQQHPRTIITRSTDGTYVARAGNLIRFGATPLDAIRELLDAEDGQRRVDAWRKLCGHE